MSALILLGGLALVVGGFFARVGLIFLTWSQLVVPFTSLPSVSFAGVVALVLFYDVSFKLKSSESAKDKRADTRTKAQRADDVMSDLGSGFALLSWGYAVVGLAYWVMR